MRLLIIGASGFVGQAVRSQLLDDDRFLDSEIYSVYRSTSSPPSQLLREIPVWVESLSELSKMEELLSRVDCIIYLAARVHQMNDITANPLQEFRIVNVELPCKLAKTAAKLGVRRFIYLSSIKVHGEKTSHNSFYTEADNLTPVDPYGISKLEAEEQLRQIALQSSLDVSIIRPPLVYGPNVKANFLQMIRIVRKGIPLPFGAIQNHRSLVYVGNLADAILTAAIHPAAANQTFLISDGKDISTPQLIRHIARSFDCSLKLLPIPVFCLQLIGKFTGKSAAIDRLTSSLRIDSSKIRQTLNWTPPYTVDQGLNATVEWFKSSS
jgi:nucleoside-diphosphate-sugar epimerase